ncbi:unnamed protein product [Tetraodon nigroviridis]|uniref:(spotted green pufferfish) hypothetical protein n=1 Tax=Tetraodon nigroviridis TaxID=99883 RepID=Q4SK48_TETNG|nr:unnamed protein product [Tetraodon nigroviridis]
MICQRAAAGVCGLTACLECLIGCEQLQLQRNRLRQQCKRVNADFSTLSPYFWKEFTNERGSEWRMRGSGMTFFHITIAYRLRYGSVRGGAGADPGAPAAAQWTGAAGGWFRITLVSFFATLPVEHLRAFPSSLSDCQTPTGWNCSGFDDRDTDLFLCDTNTCKFDGECLRIGNMVTCISHLFSLRFCLLQCNNDYAPVCGSNNQNYQNECFLRRDACKQQSEVLIMSEGACPADAGSGSGDDGTTTIANKKYLIMAAGRTVLDSIRVSCSENALAHMGGEGSAETVQKETSTCDICQFGAECDVDAEDVWCVCNIDCSHISFNPVCASDGRSYDNPCQVKEVSCQKQERIEVKHLGHCQACTHSLFMEHVYILLFVCFTVVEKDPHADSIYIPCPDHHKNYCVHGDSMFNPTLAASSHCSPTMPLQAAVTLVSKVPSAISKNTMCSTWFQAPANCTMSLSPPSSEHSKWSSYVWWCSALPESAHGPTGSTGRSRTMSTLVQRTPCEPPLDLSEPRHAAQKARPFLMFTPCPHRPNLKFSIHPPSFLALSPSVKITREEQWRRKAVAHSSQ